MPEILSAISCNLDQNILSAALPLFEAERIEAIEWSFDTLYNVKTIPEWFSELLRTFAENKRLTGHGVYFSLFSGAWSKEQENWLNHLQQVSAAFQFDHVSEHFGFMTGEDFHKGAPISIPCTPSTLAIGRDRLKRIYHSCNCPVGLENLAFSYSVEEVKRHGEFLDQLVSPVNGFIILDLHNVYCHCFNFNIGFTEILDLYPLHRVREIHISGGSIEASTINPGKSIRRDTHDNPVPEEVFELLVISIPRCPNLKYVVMEQLSNGLDAEHKRNFFYNDFIRMRNIVKKKSDVHTVANNNFLPMQLAPLGPPLQDELLSAQQSALSAILETALSYEHGKELLTSSMLANTSWQIETWDAHMLETAIAIAQKWKHGFG